MSCWLCIHQAVAGVKGSKLEKLANSDPMYRRIQALDDNSLNKYDPTVVSMLPSEKDIAAGFLKGPYTEEEIDSGEAAFKARSDEDSSMVSKKTSEDVLLEVQQDTDAPWSKSNLGSNDAPISNGLCNGKHDSNVDGLVPTAETNDIQVATPLLELQEPLTPHSDEDGPTDPEVVWALETLEKYIAHFNSQKPAAQTSEHKETAGVQNGIADNSQSVCSTAKGKGIRIKDSLIPGEFDTAKGVGSEKVALPEDQQIIPLPSTHHGRFRFFRFRKRQKEKEKKSSKRPDQTPEMNLKPDS